MSKLQDDIEKWNVEIFLHEKRLAFCKQQKALLEIQLKRISDNRGTTVFSCGIEDQRIQLGLNITQLCKLANISTPAYRSLMKGKAKPRKKTINRLNKALAKYRELPKESSK